MTGRDVPGRDGDRYDPVPVTVDRPEPFPVLPVTPRPGGTSLRPVRSVLGALLLALLAVLALGGPVGAAPTQDPSFGTTVPGDTTGTDLTATTEPVTPSTAAGDAGTTTTPEDDDATTTSSSRVADENRRLWLVVGGLVVIALALTVLTIRYWRQTRPVRASEHLPEPEPDAPATGQLPVVVATETDDDADDDVLTDEPAPSRRRGGRRSRRAVAGADHTDVDETWEPRGTGEHDRVEVGTSSRAVRPSRDQRAAAYDRHRSS